MQRAQARPAEQRQNMMKRAPLPAGNRQSSFLDGENGISDGCHEQKHWQKVCLGGLFILSVLLCEVQLGMFHLVA